jgi:hypothetical protein
MGPSAHAFVIAHNKLFLASGPWFTLLPLPGISSHALASLILIR